jgi:hypothetical protein
VEAGRPGSVPVAAPAERRAAVVRWAGGREAYLDHLKVILVGLIIAGHGVVGYARLGFWPYAEMREATLSPVTETVMLAVAIPFELFMIPLLFLVAGLLTPPSLERKGVRAYMRDRLVRLGVPFVVFVGLLWPLLMYPIHPPGQTPDSYWIEFVRHGSVDTGVLWFVGVLLIFSLVYAGWVRSRPDRATRSRQGAVTTGHLLLLAAAVTVATFLVRLVLPYYSDNKGLDLNLYQWPECVAVFGLGVVASGQGWLSAVPDRLCRRSRTVTLTAAAGFAVFVALGTAAGVVQEQVWGGWFWPALVFAALESVLAVFGPVWLLGVAQRRLHATAWWARPAAGRSAYAAFLVQGLVLIGLAVALRPVPVPAEIKALITAGGGVAGSFLIAWLLITRVPGLARIL